MALSGVIVRVDRPRAGCAKTERCWAGDARLGRFARRADEPIRILRSDRRSSSTRSAGDADGRHLCALRDVLVARRTYT
jgi:hypothetical protein